MRLKRYELKFTFFCTKFVERSTFSIEKLPELTYSTIFSWFWIPLDLCCKSVVYIHMSSFWDSQFLLLICLSLYPTCTRWMCWNQLAVKFSNPIIIFLLWVFYISIWISESVCHLYKMERSLEILDWWSGWIKDQFVRPWHFNIESHIQEHICFSICLSASWYLSANIL